jgi:predicted nucleotidyltransferase
MRDWLRVRLESVQTDILFAYIYGSSLRSDTDPRDVDIILVTMFEAGSASWERVRAFSRPLRQEFIKAFGLPLSLMIATPSEWSEIDGVVVRERADLR